MFSILMTSLTDTPLILQWEVWLTLLFGLKGLTIGSNVSRSVVVLRVSWTLVSRNSSSTSNGVGGLQPCELYKWMVICLSFYYCCLGNSLENTTAISLQIESGIIWIYDHCIHDRVILGVKTCEGHHWCKTKRTKRAKQRREEQQ